MLYTAPVVFSFCFYCFNAIAQELTPEDIDQSILYGAPNDPAYLEEGKTYMDQIIVQGDYAATEGCLLIQRRVWGGTTDGACANGSNGTFTFGYGNTVISQTQDAINDALKIAGITVVGYRWQWQIKNADVNMYKEQNQASADPFFVTVIVKDTEGNVIDERKWDYSEYIYQWEWKSGMHWYDPFVSGEDIDTITLEVEGMDAGYWAGYYGPEFGNAGIYSIFIYEQPEVDQDCSDPLLDPTCPGYATALNAQQEEIIALITDVSETPSISGDDVTFIESVNEVVEESIIDEPIVETVVQEIQEPQEQIIAEAVASVNQTADVQAEESAVSEAATEVASPSGRVDPLAVAQGAVSAALNEAASNVQSTLSATANSVIQAESISQSVEQQSQQLAASQNVESQQNNTNQQINQGQDGQSQDYFGETSISSAGGSIDSNGNIDVSTIMGIETQQDINNDGQSIDSFGLNESSGAIVEITVDSLEIAALDLAIDQVFQTALNKSILSLSKSDEEEEPQSFEDTNAKEDELVEKALSGDDSEDAQAALLGYNPEFRAYQTPQLPDNQFYQPKDIYDTQENYDNPNQRFFNGASDVIHREMVRQQYEK